MTRAAGLLALLTAAAAVLRFATLDLQSFWYDEAVTVGLVGLDLTGLLERIPDSESTPPLYYLGPGPGPASSGTGRWGSAHCRRSRDPHRARVLCRRT